MVRGSKSWIEELPGEVKSILHRVKERIDNIKRSYGSLQRYGKPPFDSIEELAVVYWLVKNKTDYRSLAKYLGIQHVSVYRWVKAIEEKGAIRIGDERVEVDPQQLLQLVGDMITPKARRWLKDVIDSATIQEFIQNPVKRQKSSKHGMFYTKSQVKKAVTTVDRLARYIKENQDLLRRLTKQEPTNNPDLWTEDFIRTVIDNYCVSMYRDGFEQLRCRRNMKLALRMIPRFRDWFSGEIGTVRQVVRPKESTLFYEHYLKLKKLARESGDPELTAFWLIAGLHIESGAREGWGSVENQLERLEAQGVKIAGVKGLADIDLDDEIANTSLIGIRWSRALWGPDGRLQGFEIYEEKTKKYWRLAFPWLDEDLHRELEKVYAETAKPKGIDSVVKSILVHYRIKLNGSSTRISIEDFRRWYTRKVKELSELLELPWTLTPHRLRSAHIAILAEFRIPMEMALSDSGFGVGWEDATTAVIFYLRFSKALLQDYIRQAEEIKKRIAGTV